ncbi:RHS repeat protein [bacterium]|nr:RHS repeat protein [bacterium]
MISAVNGKENIFNIKPKRNSWLILVLFLVSVTLYGQSDNNPGLFNERGIMTSNQVTLKSQGEKISDFNGNLSYGKVLFSKPCDKNINLSVSLMYNGAVSHTWNPLGYNKRHYRVNLPEWIINVNGIGVQVFTFPWYFQMDHDFDHTYNSGNALVEGFHKQVTPSYLFENRFFFLKGDGGFREFGRLDDYLSGEYFPLDKSDNVKAYYEGDVNFKIFETNGQVTEYAEVLNVREDDIYPDLIKYSQYHDRSKYIKLLLPKKITNHFGGTVQFAYDSTSYRSVTTFPLLSQIFTDDYNISITWSFNTTGSIINQVTATFTLPNAQTFVVTCNEHGYYSDVQQYDVDPATLTYNLPNQHFQVTSVTDLTNKTTTFNYENYTRKISDYYYDSGSSPIQDFFYFREKRLKKINYPEDGHSLITYIENSNLMPSYVINSDFRRFTSNHSIECGRDAYAANIVEKFEIFNGAVENDNTRIKKTEFDYTWNQWNPGGNHSPLDRCGYGYEYYTEKTESIGLQGGVQGNYIKKYRYKKYPYNDPLSYYAYHNLCWAVKLLSEEDIASNTISEYDWDIRNDDGNMSNGFEAGTYKLSEQRQGYDSDNDHILETGEPMYKLEYLYNSTGLLSDKIDPFGCRISLSYYTGSYWNTFNPNNGTGRYLINLPQYERFYSDPSQTTLLFTKEYNRETTYGRVNYAKTIDNQNTNFYLQESYTYTSSDPANIQTMTDRYANVMTLGYGTNSKFTGAWESKIAIVTYPDASQMNLIESKSWDQNTAHLESQTDYNNQVTSFLYHDFLRLSKIRKPGDSVGSESVSFSYYDASNYSVVQSRITESGAANPIFSEIKYVFDSIDRLKEVQLKKNSSTYNTTQYAYTEFDEKRTVTSPLLYTTAFEYDSQRRPHKTNFHDNNYTEILYSYSTRGSVLAAYPWSANWGSNEYIAIQTVYDEKRNKTVRYLDALGQLRAIKAEGVTTSAGVSQDFYTYMNYDMLGNVSHTQDPRGLITQYDYDNLGRITWKQTPDAGSVYYYYDKEGRLRFVKDANGALPANNRFTYYKYDALGRIFEQGTMSGVSNATTANAQNAAYPTSGNSPKIVYQFDKYPPTTGDIWGDRPAVSGGSNLKGNVATVAYIDENNDNWGYTFYSYDLRGRVEWIKQKLPDATIGLKTIEYDYNNNDQVCEVVVNDEFYIWYDYNMLAQMTKVYASENATRPGTEMAEYFYTSAGQVDYYTLKNSTGTVIQTINYSYTNRDWIDTISADDLYADLNYEANGNISYLSQKIDTDDNGLGDETPYGYGFTYDSINRLLTAGAFGNSATQPIQSVSYLYDKNGNILGLDRGNNTWPGQSYWYTDGNNNRLTYVSGQPENNYQYDSNGNLLRDLHSGVTADIQYDYRNLPFLVPTGSGLSVYHTYDASGNRVIKKK